MPDGTTFRLPVARTRFHGVEFRAERMVSLLQYAGGFVSYGAAVDGVEAVKIDVGDLCRFPYDSLEPAFFPSATVPVPHCDPVRKDT